MCDRRWNKRRTGLGCCWRIKRVNLDGAIGPILILEADFDQERIVKYAIVSPDGEIRLSNDTRYIVGDHYVGTDGATRLFKVFDTDLSFDKNRDLLCRYFRAINYGSTALSAEDINEFLEVHQKELEEYEFVAGEMLETVINAGPVSADELDPAFAIDINELFARLDIDRFAATATTAELVARHAEVKQKIKEGREEPYDRYESYRLNDEIYYRTINDEVINRIWRLRSDMEVSDVDPEFTTELAEIEMQVRKAIYGF